MSPEEIYQAREGDDALLKGAKLDLKVERNQVTGVLTYDGKNFDASAEQAGFDRGLGRVLGLALQGHLSMEELERGDRLRVIVVIPQGKVAAGKLRFVVPVAEGANAR